MYQEIDRLKQVQSQLDHLKEQYDQERLDLIKADFSDIVQDAETFLEGVYQRSGAFYRSWEYFEIGDEENEPKRIQDKYGINFQRQRPLREHIALQTDLFFEVSEILFERKMKEIRERGNT